MRPIPYLALAVAVLSALLGAPSEGLAGPKRTGFVGRTQSTGTGGIGILGFNLLCHIEFPGTRMCDAEEVAKTVNPPPAQEFGIGVKAWVRPSLADVNNILTSSPADCDDWTSSSGDGLALHGQDFTVSYGAIKPVPCNVFRPVACCVP